MCRVAKIFLFIYLHVIISMAFANESSIVVEGTSDQSHTTQRYSDPEYSVSELKDKLATYNKMHNTGRKLNISGLITLGIGGTMFFSGISMLANYDSNTIGTGIMLYYLGYFGIVVGTPLSISGSVIKNIGHKKKKEYEGRLDRVTLHLGPAGAELVIDF